MGVFGYKQKSGSDRLSGKERGANARKSALALGGAAGNLYAGQANRPDYKTADTKFNVEETGSQKALEQGFNSNPITSAFMGIGKAGEAAGDNVRGGLGESLFAPHKSIIRAGKTGDLTHAIPFYGSMKAADQAEAKVASDKAVADNFNRDLDKLQDAGSINNNLMTTRYDQGGDVTHTQEAEVEKNELRYDKNWNLVSDYKGAKSHENGGKDVVLNEGDKVISEKDRSRVMGLQRRYKLRGDTSAKKQLDQIEKDLPTDGDGKVFAEDGYSFKEQDGDYKVENGKYYYKPKGGEWQEQTSKESKEAMDKLNEDRGSSNAPGQALNGENAANLSVGEEQVVENSSSPLKASNEFSFTPNKDAGGFSNEVGATVSDPGGKRSTVATNEGFNDREGRGDEHLGTAMELAASLPNILNNFRRGNEELSGVNRREFTPEEQVYEDRSGLSRQSALENRNAGREALKGKGLTAGQNTGFNRANNRDFNRAIDQIDSREIQRRDRVEGFNTSLNNQASQFNLGLQNQYDVTERRQEAARDKFTNVAFSESADLGQGLVKSFYQKKKNRAQAERDRNTLSLLGTTDFGLSKDREGYKTKFKR